MQGLCLGDALLLVLWGTDLFCLFIFVSRFYDTSKQAIGAISIHFANILLSELPKKDPCSL